MNKRIITGYHGYIMTAVIEDGRAVSLDFDEASPSLSGCIYTGKVKNIVDNIKAAFVDIGCGINCFYSLRDNKKHIFLNQKNDEILKEGDEILVQVSKEAAKSKAPVLTSALSLSGKFAVVTLDKPGIYFSSKITDTEFKEKIKEKLSLLPVNDYGIIIRTNAFEADTDDIEEEVMQLIFKAARITDSAKYASCFTCVYTPIRPYIAKIRDSHIPDEETVTDSEEIFRQISDEFWDKNHDDLNRVHLYTDPYPLIKLHGLETVIDRALSKKVWLKSGGYLYIEPTEALTVIDVNTGKFIQGNDTEKTFLKINLEAVREIAMQLRLRNISGIIIIDFIDMQHKSNIDTLISALKTELKKDTVKTAFIDITPLGLAELTRQKIKKPIYEVLKA